MKIKTETLTGAALDWAVAKSRGMVQGQIALDGVMSGYYTPSTNWSQGGPIIERESIALRPHEHDVQKWSAEQPLSRTSLRLSSFSTGATPLIAAMRCYVASKLGPEIDIPEELR
jgi:hypothetical protein